MAIFSIKKSFLPNSFNIIFLPFIFVIGLIALTSVVVKIGVGQILQEKAQLAQLLKDENTLKAKENLLSQVASSAVRSADSAAAGVPDKNPLLVVISQLKNVAAENGLTISNLKSGGQSKDKGELLSVSVGFDVEGSLSNVLAFVKGVSSISPLTTVERVNINQSTGSTLSTVSVKSYWAPFPEKIPPVTEAINALSTDEQKVLSILESLTPVPYREIPPNPPIERAEPFNF